MIIPNWGWRPLFMAGGLVPLVLGALLFVVLPESPRYLASRRERWPELTRMLRRMGHNVSDDAVYGEGDGAAAKPKASLGDIFAPVYLRDTAALFASFFFCLMVNYIAILLIPAVFRESGFAQADANRVQQLFNWGGVAGALVGALVIQRLGSRMAMVGMSALAVVAALLLARSTIAAPAPFTLIALMILAGALLNGVQTTMYALATHVYPTEIRGTGVGAAVAFGRIGNVLAARVGNYALDKGGNPAYFMSWAITMGVVGLTLAAMKRHIPRSQET